MAAVNGFDPGKLRQARLDAGLTQNELSLTSGIALRNITRWESGHYAPRAKWLIRLAAVLDKPPDYFFPEAT